MAEIFTVETRGIGKPDYSREVSSGIERKGLRLAYPQTLKIFGLTFTDELSPFSWISPPLAPGAIMPLVDNETGLPGPYTVPAGYILFVVEAAHSSDEDVEIWSYVDGFLYGGMGIVSAGQQVLDHRVLGFTTALFDPTGILPHTVNVRVKNIGAGPLKGGFILVCILERVGSPPLPTTKTIRCKFCGHEETVPAEITSWICPKCESLNAFLSLAKTKRAG